MNKHADDWALPRWTPGYYLQRYLNRTLPLNEGSLSPYLATGIPAFETFRNRISDALPTYSDIDVSSLTPTEVKDVYARATGDTAPSEVVNSLNQMRLWKAMESRFGGQMANILGAGLLGGGAVGLLTSLPQWLKARKQLKEVEGISDDEKDSRGELAKTSQDDSDTGQRLWNMLEMGKMGPETSIRMPLGILPPGAPAGLAAAGGTIGGAVAANKFMHWLADRMRNKAIQVRKEKLRRQFETLMANEKYSSLNSVIDDAHSVFEKTGSWTDVPMAVLSAIGLIELLGGLKAGQHLAAAGDPNRLKVKAIEHALRLRRAGRPLEFKLPADEDEEDVVEPEVLPGLDDQALALPAHTEYDEALDLGKMGSVKHAQVSPSVPGGSSSQRLLVNPLAPPPQANSTSPMLSNPLAPGGGSQQLSPGTQLHSLPSASTYEDFAASYTPPVIDRTPGGAQGWVLDRLGIPRETVGAFRNINPATISALSDAMNQLTPEQIEALPGMLGTLSSDGGIDLGAISPETIAGILRDNPELTSSLQDQLMQNIDVGSLLSNLTPEQRSAIQDQLMSGVDVDSLMQQYMTPDRLRAMLSNPEVAQALRQQAGEAIFGGVGDWLGQVGQGFMNPQPGYGYAAMAPGLSQYLGGNGNEIIGGLMQLLSRISGAIPGIFGGSQESQTARAATDLPTNMA